MTGRAYAKLNLTLDITGRDERGYHLLSSVFACVSLADELRLTFAGDGIRLICADPRVPKDGSDLCSAAAKAFFSAMELPVPGVEIELEKHIPVCAGLGGGSSDAAAVLRLLAQKYGVALDEPRLLSAARALGADVPFFLRGGTCLAEGTGEKLTPLPWRCPGAVLILQPERGASTPEVYRRYDRDGIVYPLRTQAFLSALREKRDVSPYISNHLSAASREICPDEEPLLRQLKAAGASAAEVTGSGSAVYGLFPHRAAAQEAQAYVQAAFSAVCEFC